MDIIKFYEKGFDQDQLIVQWNLGNTCNYTCEYCPSILHNGTRPWVDLPLIENTLLKIKDHFPQKTLRVEFLGGEITLYRDFIELMKFCKEQDIKNMIFTNASRTFRHWEEVIDYLDEVLLTFHPATSDKIHFENIIKFFIEKNKKFYVHVAMQKSLFLSTAKYTKYLHDTYPGLKINMVLMMDKGHAKLFNGYFYDYSQEEIDLVKLHDTSQHHYIAEYADGNTDQYNISEIKDLKLNRFKGFKCGTTNSIINIDANGMASTSLCRQKSKINIYADNITDLFYEHICQKEVCENPSDIRIFKNKKS
jgi:organic radical activating enzyme